MTPIFWIAIKFQGRSYRYHVTYTLINERTEQFIIKGKNKTITFHSNRPYIKSHVGLKKWAPTYEIVQGDLNNMYFRELIVQELNRIVNKQG